MGAQAVGKYWESALVSPLPPRAAVSLIAMGVVPEPLRQRVVLAEPSLEVPLLEGVDDVVYPLCALRPALVSPKR
ncbi:MAG: hypothetical protein ACK4WM_02085 [Thermoflexales bacterium]